MQKRLGEGRVVGKKKLTVVASGTMAGVGR